jgi:spore coat polysaccharide biosynthesis protein SpsF
MTKVKKLGRTGIIVQARMGSSRLPGKVLLKVLAQPLLEILLNRLSRCQLADQLIVATTTNETDRVIEDLAKRLAVPCYRGSEDDVLERYYMAARANDIDTIVRITADCPLMDPQLVDTIIETYSKSTGIDFVANTVVRTYPRGFDVEVFSFRSLAEVHEQARESYQREHVTPFFYEHMKCLNHAAARDASNYRVTVDTLEDFQVVRTILEELGFDKPFTYLDVISLLDSRPQLALINREIEQKKKDVLGRIL